MRSLPLKTLANINLKGKKVCKLSCGCCTIQNLTEREINKIIIKETRREIVEHLHEGNDYGRS